MPAINQAPAPPAALPTLPGVYPNPRATGSQLIDDDTAAPVTTMRGIVAGANVNIAIVGDDLEISAVGAGGATNIDELTDGYNVGTNMSLGQKLTAPSGTDNTVVSNAATSITSGSDNTIVGGAAGALLTTENDCTYIGTRAGASATIGNGNTVVGSESYLNASATGDDNSIFGKSAGQALTTGFNNTLLGAGTNVTAPGNQVGCIAIGIDDTGTGAIATTNNTLYFHKKLPAVASGGSARPMVYSAADGSCGPIAYGSATEVLTMTGAGTIGWASVPGGISEVNGLTDGYHVGGNIAVGAKPTTYTGFNNVHLTATALPATVGGSANVGIGDQALSNAALTGSNNIQLGFGAGNGITTGNRNINIGSTNSVGTGSDNITIGQSAMVNPFGNNQIALGQGASCAQNNSIAVNPAIVAPTASNKLIAFDTTTGEIGPTAIMAANRVMGQNSAGTALEAKNIVGSTGLTVNHTAGQIELVNNVNPVADGAIVIGNGLGVGSQITAFTAATGQLIHEKGGLEANVSAYDGFPQIKAGATSNLKTNWTATVAPTATDDSAAGYSVGSAWIDITADNVYQCVDATATAAVWKQLDAAAGAVAIDNLTDAKTNANAVSLGYKPATGFGGQSISVSKTGPALVPGGLCAVAPLIPSLTGIDNTFMGKGAGLALASGASNAFFATNAGSLCTIGTGNVCVGQGSNLVTGNENSVIAIGSGATCGADSGIAIGTNAANTIADALNFPTTLAAPSGTDLQAMVFKSATGQTGPLALGTANQVLATNAGATGVEWKTVSSGAIAWGKCTSSTPVSQGNSTVSFGTVTASGGAITTATNGVNIVTAGTYLCIATIDSGNDAVGSAAGAFNFYNGTSNFGNGSLVQYDTITTLTSRYPATFQTIQTFTGGETITVVASGTTNFAVFLRTFTVMKLA